MGAPLHNFKWRSLLACAVFATCTTLCHQNLQFYSKYKFDCLTQGHTRHQQELVSTIFLILFAPRSVVYFLGGTLPGEALLHIRQLTIFGMICRLHDNISHGIAKHVLSYETPATKSWFHQIQELCLQYSLPEPLHQLQSPLPKITAKNLIKKNVIDYWERLLRAEASDPRYSSLVFINPNFMSLTALRKDDTQNREAFFLWK